MTSIMFPHIFNILSMHFRVPMKTVVTLWGSDCNGVSDGRSPKITAPFCYVYTDNYEVGLLWYVIVML